MVFVLNTGFCLFLIMHLIAYAMYHIACCIVICSVSKVLVFGGTYYSMKLFFLQLGCYQPIFLYSMSVFAAMFVSLPLILNVAYGSIPVCRRKWWI